MARSLRCLTLAALALATQACSSPPPALPASGEVRVHALLNSDQCGMRAWGATVALISTHEDWGRAWHHINGAQVPLPPQPEVDFSITRIAVVSGGRFTTGGYGLHLHADVAVLEDGVLRLPVTLTRPAAGSTVTQAMSSPCLVVAFRAPTVTRVEALGAASGASTQLF